MSDVTVSLEAGVCQFRTVVTASMDEEMNIVFKIKSGCPNVREMSKKLEPISLFEAISTPFTTNPIYCACSDLPHASCPVPCAMAKVSEVAGELALKKDVNITFE